jgi:hypothetical protein
VRPISAGSGFESLMAHKHPGQRPTRLLTFFFGHGFATELADRDASLNAQLTLLPAAQAILDQIPS